MNTLKIKEIHPISPTILVASKVLSKREKCVRVFLVKQYYVQHRSGRSATSQPNASMHHTTKSCNCLFFRGTHRRFPPKYIYPECF